MPNTWVPLTDGVMRMSQNLNDDMESHRGNMSRCQYNKGEGAPCVAKTQWIMKDCMCIMSTIIANQSARVASEACFVPHATLPRETS